MTINPLTKVNKSKVCMISIKSFHGGTIWTEPGTIHFKREKWNGEARGGETSCVTLPDCTVDYRFVYTVNRWHTCMHSHKHNHTQSLTITHTHDRIVDYIHTAQSWHYRTTTSAVPQPHRMLYKSAEMVGWDNNNIQYRVFSALSHLCMSSQLSEKCSGGALLTGQNMKDVITELLSQSRDLSNIWCIVTCIQQAYSSQVILVIKQRSEKPLNLQ